MSWASGQGEGWALPWTSTPVAPPREHPRFLCGLGVPPGAFPRGWSTRVSFPIRICRQKFCNLGLIKQLFLKCETASAAVRSTRPASCWWAPPRAAELCPVTSREVSLRPTGLVVTSSWSSSSQAFDSFLGGLRTFHKFWVTGCEDGRQGMT